MNMQQWLKSQQEKAKQQLADASKGGGFENLPDGKYVAQLTNAELGESKSSGRPQVAWKYVVLEGPEKGRFIFDYDGLDREDGFLWLGRKLARFGLDPTTIDPMQIPAILDQLTNDEPVVRLRLRTSRKDGNEFQNATIEKVIEDYTPGMFGDAAPPAAPPSGGGGEEELKIGMRIRYKWRGADTEGEVKSINDAEGSVMVDTDGKEREVEVDKILGIVSDGTDD